MQATKKPLKQIILISLFILTIPWMTAISWADTVIHQGMVTVVDGDNVIINGINIRLYGIDAPEANQLCQRNQQQWPCGQEATRQLEKLTGNQTVVCEQRDVDKYGRPVADCHVGEQNLSSEMVKLGLAIAYTRYSNAYIVEQSAAHQQKLGLWSGEFVDPEQWRRETKSKTATFQQVNASVYAAEIQTDQEIRDRIIQESIMAYRGSCPCPYSINRAGRRCGGNSAYSKPGGAQPFCFHHDISESMVERYKDRER